METNNTISISLKTPWYLNSVLICILFALWFVYGIPLLLGICLLIVKRRYQKKLAIQVQDLSQHYKDAQNLLTPEMQDAHQLQILIGSLHEEESIANKNLSDML